MANPTILSDAMAHRRDDPVYETELPSGRYSSTDLSSPSEYDGDSHCCVLLCDGVPGTEDEVEGVSPACNGGCKAIVRDTGFPLLCSSCDGIREYLFGRQKGLQGFFQQWHEENNQLLLFDP